MADTTGVISNVRVGFSESSPVSWTSIPKIVDVKVPVKTTAKVDTTVYSASKFRTNIPGFTEISALEVTMLLDLDEANTNTGTVQDSLWDLQVSQADVYVRYEVAADAANTKWTAFEFYAKVASWEPSAPLGDKTTLKVVFENSSTWFNKLAAGSSSLS